MGVAAGVDMLRDHRDIDLLVCLRSGGKAFDNVMASKLYCAELFPAGGDLELEGTSKPAIHERVIIRFMNRPAARGKRAYMNRRGL